MRKWWLLVLVGFPVIVSALILIYFRSVNQMYKYAVTRQQMVMVGERLKVYYQRRGVFPVDARPYLVGESLPITDQWGEPYLIEITTDRFSITSLGSDHHTGGAGTATDIVVKWRRGTEKLTVISADIHP
jgi:hypothetical protein